MMFKKIKERIQFLKFAYDHRRMTPLEEPIRFSERTLRPTLAAACRVVPAGASDIEISICEEELKYDVAGFIARNVETHRTNGDGFIKLEKRVWISAYSWEGKE